jgi:hypothetical protein
MAVKTVQSAEAYRDGFPQARDIDRFKPTHREKIAIACSQ